MIINKNLISNISNITDYDLIKDYLFIRVCNLEQNELKDMPHTAIGDLAITYHIVIKSSDTQICSAKITNNLLNAYGITLDQLHEDARMSSPKMIPPHVQTLESMILGIPDEVVERNSNVKMYIVTNEHNSDGAAAIFYPELLNSLSAKLDSSLYVIPSSVDECIVIAENKNVKPKDLKEMLYIVNRSDALSEDKFLSDTVYHYDKDTRLFERYDDYQKMVNKNRFQCH